MRRRRHKSDEAEINIAPMLDIIFILLIFFIVTTSFVKEFGVDMSDIRAVRANIESGLASSPESPVVVAASRKADAGLLVRVVDQARVAGAHRVSLVALVQ
jgi:biopolymer transport protein ExbD